MKIIIRLVPPKVTARLRHLGSGKDWDLLVKEGSRVVSRTSGHRSTGMADRHLDKVLKENNLKLSKGGYDFEEPAVTAVKRWRRTKQGQAVFREKLKASWRNKNNPDGWRRKQKDNMREIRQTAYKRRIQIDDALSRMRGKPLRTRKEKELLARGTHYVGDDFKIYERPPVYRGPPLYVD